jgi:hypothetical protein
MSVKEDQSDPLDNIQISESKKKMLRELSDKHTKEVEKKALESKEEEDSIQVTVNIYLNNKKIFILYFSILMSVLPPQV